DLDEGHRRAPVIDDVVLDSLLTAISDAGRHVDPSRAAAGLLQQHRTLRQRGDHIVHAVAVPAGLRAGSKIPARDPDPVVVDQHFMGSLRAPGHQSISFSTARMQSTISSICPFSTISGGDSAMMSPVVRISTPFSNAFTKAEKARLVGCPAIGCNSTAPSRPVLRMSMTCGGCFGVCSASAL